MIGLVVDLENRCGRDLLRGVCRIGHQFGWRPVFVRQPWSDGGTTPFPRPLAGVIGYLDPLGKRQLGIPCVDLKQQPNAPDPPIVIDDEEVGRSAARHLLDQGLTSLAVVATAAMHPIASRRIAGFRQAAFAAGVPCQVFCPSVEQPPEILRLLTPWLAALPVPSGVFGIGDYYADLVLTACADAGLPVPSRISVIGADDDEVRCLLATVPLSSIALPHAEIGAAAALRLQALLTGSNLGPPIVLPPGPVITRASTDILAASDPVLASVAAFIRANLTANLTIDRIVTSVGLNRRTLERRFRDVLRRSIHDEIRALRVQRGMELLSIGELPISAVALSTGLSHNAFLSAFQAVTGQTPNAWRQARRVRLTGKGAPPAPQRRRR